LISSDAMSTESPNALSLEKVPDSEGMRRLLRWCRCGWANSSHADIL